jgi:hypothetical protein
VAPSLVAAAQRVISVVGVGGGSPTGALRAPSATGPVTARPHRTDSVCFTSSKALCPLRLRPGGRILGWTARGPRGRASRVVSVRGARREGSGGAMLGNPRTAMCPRLHPRDRAVALSARSRSVGNRRRSSSAQAPATPLSRTSTLLSASSPGVS